MLISSPAAAAAKIFVPCNKLMFNEKIQRFAYDLFKLILLDPQGKLSCLKQCNDQNGPLYLHRIA